MSTLDPNTLVEEWQRPLFNLAYRMIGNETDAADATQEIFAVLLTRIGRFDPTREVKPWIYKVATHEIYRFLRKQRTRDQKEGQAAVHQQPLSEIDSAERKEIENLIHQEIATLEEQSRSAFVLHLYRGLSQTEVAEILELPRTTIQSRLQTALTRIRKKLTTAGYPTMAAPLETFVSNAPPVEVPIALQTSLTKLVVSTAVVPGSVAATIGGILMTKGMIIGSSAIVLLCLGLGYVAGRLGSSPSSPPKNDLTQASVDTDPRVSRSRFDRLAKEHAAALEEIRRMENDAQRTEARSPATRDSTDVDPANASEDANGKDKSKDQTSGIEWGRFRKILAQNMDDLLTMIAARESGDDETMDAFKPEFQTILMELMTEGMRITMQAKAISPVPFLEETILDELLDSVLSGPLSLSETQRSALSSYVVRPKA